MATYHSGVQIDHAQAALDKHAVSGGNGLCVECKVLGPCVEHDAAAKAFMRAPRLPRRRSRATRPELMGARRADFHWLSARAG